MLLKKRNIQSSPNKILEQISGLDFAIDAKQLSEVL